MKTEQLLAQYHEVKLAKYLKTRQPRDAAIAAKYALDDMTVTVRQTREIYGNEDSVHSILKMEIEDVVGVQ